MAERVCCLYRVSTTKQVDFDDKNQANIPVQRKACREFVEKMGWTIVYEEQEAGVSGFKVSADKRDAIQRIKEYAEQGKFDILLVFMFDRIGRRAEETPFVVEWLILHGIRVWSANEGEQRMDSHADRLTNFIRFWQADGESQKTAIRTKTALGQMVMEGRFRGGVAPYGYRLEKSGVFNKRIRYVCYNKRRRRLECDGPTGYTMHLLDEQVTAVLHRIFDRMAAASDEDIISAVQDRNAMQLKADIRRVKAENAKANTEYESLKAEVIKAVQGKSKMPMDVLSELVDESRARVMETSARLTELLAEQNEIEEKEAGMRAELQQIRTWREIFDTSEMDVKKMIANYIIKRVNVYRDYKLDIVLNMNVQQYMDGLDSITAKHTA